MTRNAQSAAPPSARLRTLTGTLSYLPDSLRHLITLVALLAVGAALPVAASAGLKMTLDALPGGDHTLFVRGLVVLVCSFTAAAVIGAVSTKARTTILETIAVNQRWRIAETALSLPLRDADRLERGDVVSRLTADVTESAKYLTNLYQTADIVLKAVAAAGYMLFLSRPVGLAVVVCSVAVVAAASLTNRGIPGAAKGFQGALGTMSASALNIAEGWAVIKAFLAGERMVRTFDRRAAAVATAGQQLAGRVAAAVFWSVIFAYLPLVAAFGFGGYMVAVGRLSFGGIMAILHLCDYFGPLSLLGDQLAQAQRSAGALARVQEFVARTGSAVVSRSPKTTALPDGIALAAEHVWFGYDGGPPVLKDVSLAVARGERIAVMGRSGSGKSTMLKVLAGLYLPAGGAVAAGASTDGTGAAVTYQPQEPFLFPGTIRDNLLIADAGASPGQLVSALATADAAGFVADLDAGLDSEAGERGGRLSGGQRQRLALARTLLRRSPIMLLDEPTGSLDRDSEARVLDALRALPDVTLVIVTHRPETAESCDRIIVMDAGAIAESGSHAELLARQGLYRTLLAEKDATALLPPGETEGDVA